MEIVTTTQPQEATMDAITLIETAAAPYVAAGYVPTDGEPGEWLELSDRESCVVIEIDGADEDAEITITKIDGEGTSIVQQPDPEEPVDAATQGTVPVTFTDDRDARRAQYEAQGEEAFDWNDDDAVTYGTPDDPFGINAPTVAYVTYGPIGGPSNETRFTDLADAAEFAHDYRTSGPERIATVTYEGPHAPKHSDLEFARGWIGKLEAGQQIGYTAGSPVLCSLEDGEYRIYTAASRRAGIWASKKSLEAAAVTMVLVADAMERSGS